MNSSETPVVVFHHPGPVEAKGRTGSQVRPWQLLQAFREEGYEVLPVVGRGVERQQQIKVAKKVLRSGKKLSFVYSESRSIPTLLAESHRLPLFPTMDFRFLKSMREAGVPVGLFYRDVFWRFDMYRAMLSWPARMITVPLYQYDWWWYRRVVDHLFLPSVAMSAHLATAWPKDNISALPPGTHLPGIAAIPESIRQPESLQLLYVGGVHPPAYDLVPLLRAVGETPRVKLALCCRPEEWATVRSYYADWINDRVEVVHRTGDDLRGLYARADLFALLRQPHEYLDFAVPVKLFESVGYGLPIVTLEGTEAARMVEQHGLGWVVPDTDSVAPLLQRLQEAPELLAQKRAAVAQARAQHTWGARVREIVRQLGRYDRR